MLAQVLTRPWHADPAHSDAGDVDFPDSQLAHLNLARSIERSIRSRTGGRVRRLNVEVAGGRIVVRGSAATYHVKQLALQAVLDTAGSAGARPVKLDVHVRPGPAPRTFQRAGSPRDA
ncbi:MAG: hypothetical protein HYS13_10300 [Planctomycetia bacterium]|nr:hypothetical protein [Planctomycetia bacterium]